MLEPLRPDSNQECSKVMLKPLQPDSNRMLLAPNHSLHLGNSVAVAHLPVLVNVIVLPHHLLNDGVPWVGLTLELLIVLADLFGGQAQLACSEPFGFHGCSAVREGSFTLHTCLSPQLVHTLLSTPFNTRYGSMTNRHSLCNACLARQLPSARNKLEQLQAILTARSLSRDPPGGHVSTCWPYGRSFWLAALSQPPHACFSSHPGFCTVSRKFCSRVDFQEAK